MNKHLRQFQRDARPDPRLPIRWMPVEDPEERRSRTLITVALSIVLLALLALGFAGCISPRTLHPHVVDLYVQAQTVHDACAEQRVLDEETKCSERAQRKLAEAARRLVCLVEGEKCT